MRPGAFLIVLLIAGVHAFPQKKAVFIILDGIPADVIEKVDTPFLDELSGKNGYTRAYLGGEKDGYSESPTISAVGYNTLLTGTWANKHNVRDNNIQSPNYYYWNIFRIFRAQRPRGKTAIFSTWTDNRTKLVGEGLGEAGNFRFDFVFDGYENDTVRFPHKSKSYIADIDELVTNSAEHTIQEQGPDLSWVYLEYTDDMGHQYGDSPQFYDAVKKADAQVGKIWNAVKARQAKTGEQWMILVTTDHGRDAATGKNHGGQSDRERTIWIATNTKDINKRFSTDAATVDIAPSILRFLGIKIPDEQRREMDGVPFLGKLSFTNLKVVKKGNSLEVSWDPVDTSGQVNVYLAKTNNFLTGEADEYIPIGHAPVAARKALIQSLPPSGFYKVLVEGESNSMNTWVKVK